MKERQSMPQEPEVKALLSPSPEEQDRSVDEAREEIKTANKLRKKVPLITQIMALAAGNTSSREFVLRVVQPGLAGLMDGSVSTLAPIFAAAFITKRPMDAFLVGIASAMGAGISMAFSEALSDDGVLTGRGSPVIRGAITGGMTFFGGSLHTLPFLIPNLHAALVAAYIVVAIELLLIAAIRHRFFGTRWWVSILQVVGGGALVFAAAYLFGNA
jgi:VIT1/CCC1 family predicted Fe2+/Mn2+ transporter